MGEAAVNYHVERDGEIILGPAVARYGDGKSWDRWGGDGWDACYHAQNTLETDKEVGPLLKGDVIVRQIDLNHVSARKYVGNTWNTRGTFGQRFVKAGNDSMVGSVGTVLDLPGVEGMTYEEYQAKLDTLDEMIAHHNRKAHEYIDQRSILRNAWAYGEGA